VSSLEQQNADYIRSVAESDVAWFRANLSDDFLCTLGDGGTIAKDAFLERIAMGPGVDDITFEVVAIREFGDFALVHGITHYRQDGAPGSRAYTDAWRRQGDSWVALSAQLTPVS
jgi:ketosteroid isomerase-like protein